MPPIRTYLAPSVTAAGAPPTPGPPAISEEEARRAATRWNDAYNISRRLGFYIALAYVFTRFSLIHELFTYVLGHRPYLVLLLAPPAMLSVLLTGGLRRTLQARPAYYWCAFAVWLVAATPFSFWRTGAINYMEFFLKTEFPMLFIIGGLTLTLKECRLMMYAIALGGVVNVFVGRFFSMSSAERLSLSFGSVSNANDLAAHLLLTLSFLLFAFLTKPLLVRLPVLLVGASGLWTVLATGSRAGLIALAAGILFIFLRTSMRQRVALAAMFSLIGVLAVVTLPRQTLKRLTFFSSEVDQSDEALAEAAGSQATRTYLAKRALYVTALHPVFGVGPGEFPDYEAHLAKEEGRRGVWQATHNSYLEVSAEGGVPAIALYLAAFFSTYILLNGVYKRARRDPAGGEIASAALCLMLALVTLGVSSFFLSLAYRYYLPSIIGLGISFAAAAEAEKRAPLAVAQPAGRPA